MSYLSNCESDLFISYAHFDDAPMFEGQKGWVEVFHQALEVRLRQLLGEEAFVWRDPKLTGNEYFEETLEKRLLKTALLLSVVSPRYVRSKSCLDEIDAFCRGAAQSGGIRFQDKARLLKVVKTEVLREEMPSPLQPLLGYEFYALDQAKRPREFRLPPTAGDDSYKACLDTLEDLAYDIKLTLEALRKSELQTPKDVDAARVVYIADTVLELRAQSDQLRRELRQRGYVVYPCEVAPENGARYREFVAEQLGKAGLSVHLLGSLYGVALEGESRSTIEVQVEESGRLAATGGLRRVLWLPENLTPGEERQQRFIETLERDAANQPNTELLQTSIENLKTFLLRTLATSSAKPAAAARPATAPPIVYLIHDQRDAGAVEPLRDVLMARGYEVKPSYFEGAESELREYHQDNLVHSDAAIIYYGAPSELWVQRKLADLRKAFGLGRGRPYQAKALVVGAPARPDKERLRTQEALVISATEGLTAETLAPFLDQFAGRG